MEKGEAAVRLSSTQEEVHQLRKGIEKLRVRIEADEKKQLHVSEKLKASERRNDSLQDKVGDPLKGSCRWQKKTRSW